MNRISFILLSTLIVLLLGCVKSEYDRLVNYQLSRNVRYDSLFLNLKFGMTRRDFYASCWEMNKEGLIMQGPGNLSVQYEIDTTHVKSAMFMRFYPNFYEDKIYEMPVEFVYEAWAPWNSSLSADSLLYDVKKLMESWYGGEFKPFINEDKNFAIWVKIDGNRRIRMYIKNISTVKVEFLDLTVKPTMDKSVDE